MDNPSYEKLINAAIRFVSFRPRSEHELREFLLKKPNNEDIEKVIIRMRELGYVNDEKFAAWWVEQRTAFRSKGNRIIEFELIQKGVAKNIILEALLGRDSLAAAKKAISKKKIDKKKLYEYLARRGFDADTISKVQYGV